MSLPLNPTALSSCRECTDLNESQKFKRKDQKDGLGNLSTWDGTQVGMGDSRFPF